MNQTHLHLLITHLPIFGSILGTFVLLYGLWKKSDQTIIAAYYVCIFSAIGAVIAYLTGEAAEETVENIQGITKSVIEAHEDFAIDALISLIIFGVTSIGGIFATIKKSSISRTFAVIVLLISLISFGLAARTGYLGGQIRHTEISSGTPVQNTGGDQEKEHED
jgi:uncharacterized membrane protein